MTEFNYAKYQEALLSLIEKTKNLLADTDNQALVSKLDAELEQATDRKELSLAFVGQYSSGKSTIISAMTGDKQIKIDANVATDVVSKYEWNNILLMDTPGILAGKKESHDEATKEALKESDLIFYVLTSQLFDDIIFNNFIDLAYNQRLADKMFIVINKMGMESGEYDELVENYTVSLQKIFAERGYSLDQFPVAFIDAYDYIQGEDEKDEEFIKLSHFGRFLDMLNAFVDQKGLIKKQFDTPVRILQSYLKNIQVAEVDKTISDFYNQFEQKLTSSEKELKRDVEQVLSWFDSSCMNEVINLSSEIGAIDEEAVWTQKQNDLSNKLSNMISEASDRIDTSINQNYDRLLKEMSEFSGKEALVKYTESIDAKINSPSISVEEKKSLTTQRNSLTYLLKQGANKVSSMAPGVNSISGGISAASGSTLHEGVLTIGHFFGKKFKPWEAVRWASNIGKVAKFGIPVLATGLDIWMQVREDKRENERIEQIKSAKNQFVTTYQCEINKIKSQFEDYLHTILENYANKRDEINKSKDEFITLSTRNEELGRSIKDLEGEYVDFIEIIDGNEE
ncbi:GTPase [uncultured Porphyromonas sp.]|uniref:GTPase n=1 Tax=uncultured Porphyromonas sp. TaxID=159274 RepID=UPI0026166FBB|nr:GTPase [uncultured Porphyromonas sp.]